MTALSAVERERERFTKKEGGSERERERESLSALQILVDARPRISGDSFRRKCADSLKVSIFHFISVEAQKEREEIG